jgi:hypothetical protein
MVNVITYELGRQLSGYRHQVLLEVFHHLVHRKIEKIKICLFRKTKEICYAG